MHEPFRTLPRGIQVFTLGLNIVFLATATWGVVHSRPVVVGALALVFGAASLVKPLPNPTGGQNFPNNSVKIVAALLWQPSEVLLGVGVGTFLGLLLLRRNEGWRAANNGAGWGLSSGAATLIAHQVMPSGNNDLLPLTSAALLAVLTNRVVNEGIFSIYQVLRTGHSFPATWLQNVAEQWFGQTLPAAMAVIFASVAGKLNGIWPGLALTGASVMALPVPRQELAYYHRFQTTRGEIVEAMVRALEAIAPGARDRGDRVSALAVETGRRLGMSERALRSVRLASRLHEVGLLAGTESSEPEEHLGIVGGRILARFPDPLIAEIIRTYQDRWDGRAPVGRKRRRLSVGARLVATAAIYDSTRTELSTFEETAKHLRDLAGTVLDPRVVKTLIDVAAEHDGTSSTTR